MIAMVTVESGSSTTITPPTATGTWTLINRVDQGPGKHRDGHVPEVRGPGRCRRFILRLRPRASQPRRPVAGSSPTPTCTPRPRSTLPARRTPTPRARCTANQVTTVTASTRLIAFFSFKNNCAHPATNSVTMDTRISAAASTDGFESSAHDETRTAIGATGTRTSAGGSGEWAAQLIALRPAPDTTPPTVTIGHPANSSTHGSDTYNAGCSTPLTGDICGTASDATGVASVELSIQQGSGNYWGGGQLQQRQPGILHGDRDHELVPYVFPVTNFPTDGTYTSGSRRPPTRPPRRTPAHR